MVCDANPGAPVGESCDALDNDCDGDVDEGFVGLGTACTDGVGLCERAGVRVCAAGGGGVTCNAEAGDPLPDLCDGLDNDCDGDADEDFVSKNAPCTVGQGICRRVGVRECRADGLATECNEAPGDAEVEVCDLLDNDCNGTVDDAWPTAGQACNAGLGICRRAGVLVCDAANRAGPVVCDAVPGDANPAETCDYQDDDCNGSIDEDFVDGQGRYVGLANCGACGTDCDALWAPNAAAFGAAPVCRVIAGAAQCDFDCLAGFLDADGVPNNGCELEIDADAIYVATPANGGEDLGGCGTVQSPCATIGFGITRADTPPLKRRVRVSDGVYSESISLVAGVDVLGGHHRTTWVRDPDLNITIIEGQSGAAQHKKAVSAIGIQEATTLDGFVVNGESALSEGNSYAVYIRDSGAALEITNNRIFAGDGGRGADGEAGGSGTPGTSGDPGSISFGVILPDCAGAPDNVDSGAVAGDGGQRMCGVVAVHGGRGGDSACPARGTQEGTGDAGQGPGGAAGGDGAWGFDANVSNSCTVSDEGPSDASPGGDGGQGGDGLGGGGAAGGSGQLGGFDWVGNTGVGGANGVAGGGGGGGGAAAGVRILWLAFAAADFGAAGGGGGSGGCEGAGGAAGAAGGASFGVFVVYSGAGPDDLGDFPTVEDNEIRRGLGGAGGAGGNGGGGGEGGNGGAGGPRAAPGTVLMDFCSFEGGAGGAGARGGHGGGGGGGQGGASFDVFVANHNNLAPAYEDDNDFTLLAGVGTHGVGGPGGNSSNTDTGEGDDGASGTSGNVGGLP